MQTRGTKHMVNVVGNQGFQILRVMVNRAGILKSVPQGLLFILSHNNIKMLNICSTKYCCLWKYCRHLT